ncbi:GNAT family N-acetyltransferase [Arthrospira platensis]|uniref:Aminoglycoside 6'-N-acetyltransferase n=1 Tax=Limnospira platensis NIES-46 TaxID=1236695 RepID=A0A5M3T9F5_LIMPL|nr:GNAT family N-acetyltransferase [Arthrospira platensis]AMW27843.1 aminoglycoside 6'-acetyltransferase [Arthrospira platensis YZ]KDR58420.1 aminoglycoside 6'-acetyltransferase [Arthrospira platensis str. Paraca]MBD2671240.1 GNAT family N-acetyltransferase [Arthrospira platensis FACHB-439]MBD2712150.1 GNAT family N-acetyltransferase [Arthrospira platensis FACHB-835]MDF2210752.1 GNAT family N-acetyltransferase [Arthrospira platensis NCB002]MDT9296884.1 GNAT family N-acetyltransferase [Arthros
MRIINLSPNNQNHIHQAATLLVAEFRENWPNAWPTYERGLAEVMESFGDDRVNLVAVDENDNLLGWIGGISQYQGHVWELHPLVVKSDYQGLGIGRKLVANLEDYVRSQGGLTLWLGTDDENNLTSLSGVELYPHFLENIANIKNHGRHPYEFYQKCGFVIMGVVPDANGIGKPDILMAKSLRIDNHPKSN